MIRIPLRYSLVLALSAVTLLPSLGSAQGTLSGQGFGYPSGQFGARAAATAGALGPFDAISPINPSSLAQWGRSVLFFHLEPEFRSTNADGTKSSTSQYRFPLVGGATRIGKHAAVGLTFSTYLDRTWQTVSVTREELESDTVDLTTRYSSNGAINDLRLAMAWTFSAKLHAGIGLHRYAGENRLNINWDFPDSVPFGDVTENSTLTYGGSAVSLGGDWRVAKHFQLAAYVRHGGSASLHIGDTLISRGDMPDHFGGAVAYDGVTATTIAAGFEHVGWSGLQGLGSSGLVVRDADRMSIGAETRGPSIGKVPVFLRAGLARRSLPFDALSKEVHETLVSFGAGYTLARGLANLDIGIQHASRSAGSAKETAWLWTLGIAISP